MCKFRVNIKSNDFSIENLKSNAMNLFFKIFILFSSLLFAQPSELHFKNIEQKDGLSSNTVNCTVQDQSGFLWFGTAAGLDRYDGYDIVSFRNNPLDSNSISNSYVGTIFIDSKNR